MQLWHEEQYRSAELLSRLAAERIAYPRTRNLVQMAVAVASETVVRFVGSGVRESRTVTLRDFTDPGGGGR